MDSFLAVTHHPQQHQHDYTTADASVSPPTPTSHQHSPDSYDHQQQRSAPPPPLFIVNEPASHPHQHSAASDASLHWSPPIHPPPSDKRRVDQLDVPFSFNSNYVAPFTWEQQQQLSEGRRWSMCDPQPASAPASSTTFAQRPWTSGSPSTPMSAGLPSTTSSASVASASGFQTANPPSTTTADTATGGYHLGASASASSPNSRPSTTSSLSSYASSSHLATPNSASVDAFFAPSANYSYKKRESNPFYTIAHNDSTDTIVDARSAHTPSSSSQLPFTTTTTMSGIGGNYPHHPHGHHYQHQPQQHHHHQPPPPPPPAPAPMSSSSFPGTDDSNPFFFARELQSLHVQEHQTQARSQLPRRPSSSHHLGLHPTLQTAIATTSSTDTYQFYDYSTPPSTAGSTAAYYDAVGLATRPSTGLPSVPNAAAAYLAQGRRDSMPSLGGHHPHHNPHAAASMSANLAGVTPGAPSPYSLIVENPDPATRASRPHLCTHCNETFRRIHDAKRHAYGALGIKNYACMGGCGMTFKRSEGRARHWQREEVAGVGNAITVGEFFACNPGLRDTQVGSRDLETVPEHSMMIWGGFGCEKRHGAMMNGTMEEDRRLRNKARRDRILMISARQAQQAAKKAEEDKQQQPSSSGSGSTAVGQQSQSPTTPEGVDAGAGIGPTRHRRTAYASAPGVSPY